MPAVALASRDTAVAALMRDHRPDHLSVLCLDLDAFKSVNDRFGHAVGDEVLRATAARIEELSPPGAVSARLGGEEFAVVVPGDDARAFARSLVTEIHLTELFAYPDSATDEYLRTARGISGPSLRPCAISASSPPTHSSMNTRCHR